MNKQGDQVANCTVRRLMREMELRGGGFGRRRRTTIPGDAGERPLDLVDRKFVATRPNQLWVADITYVATWSGFAYTAFITDVFSRRIVGWRVSNTLRADLALDALEMAIWARGNEGLDVGGVVHHSDRGVQYLAIRYSDRLEQADAVASVGSKGDSFDNALAEAVNSRYKRELIYHPDFGPWRTVDDVEFETLSWVHWWNHERLHTSIGDMAPVEFEAIWRNDPKNQPLSSAERLPIESGGTNHPTEPSLHDDPVAELTT